MGDYRVTYATYGVRGGGGGNALDSGLALAASPDSASRETCCSMIDLRLITEMVN